MGRFGRHPDADWTVAASILGVDRYEERLDRVLERVGAATGCPLVHLYLPDASGRRMRLERTRGRAADPVGGEDALLSAEQDQGGGAGFSAPTAALELPLGPEDAQDRTVQTPLGPMRALALTDEGGELRAVIHTGPINGSSLRRSQTARVERLRGPLCFVIDQAVSAESVHQRLADATARLEAQERIAGSALDVNRFTQLLLDMALSSTETDAGFVAIAREATGQLEIRAQSGMPDGFEQALDLSPEGGTFDWSVAEFGGALTLADFEAATRLGIQSLLAVPLVEDTEALGIFALVNFGQGGTFDEGGLELCSVFADQIRLMLHNQRVFHEFAERYVETLKALAKALDARLPQTQDHHPRVAGVATALGRELGLADSRLEALDTAGLIHDVGLAAVGGAEGAAESDIEHPSVGASLIEHLPVHSDLVAAVATHHEWHDGWGFPQGLAGEHIPVAGRVLGMAEFLVEMTTQTPVRPAWDTDRLLAEIAARRGTQFDPDVADAATRLLSGQSAQVLSHLRR
jgi:putative nucleotidyltransferase with HDIG domain